MTDPINLEQLRQWIGRERTTADPMHSHPAQALAGALNRNDLALAGEALPLCWHWLYFLEAPRATETGDDGHPKLGGFLPPVPLPRRMWAAGSLQVESPLRLGLTATRTSRIRDVTLKAGKTGTLVFVTLDHTISQANRLCIREEQNLVYRAMPTGAAPLPAGETSPQAPGWTRRVQPSTTLLFRYSALTYNSHRIHYDRQYAIEQEFYPALVVQGPLLATLLLELVHEHQPTRRLAGFDFRASRPTFDNQPFTLNGHDSGNAVQLWTADAEGFTGMNATARFA